MGGHSWSGYPWVSIPGPGFPMADERFCPMADERFCLGLMSGFAPFLSNERFCTISGQMSGFLAKLVVS